MKNVLLVYGGDGNEHAISIRSKEYLAEQLRNTGRANVIEVEIKDRLWHCNGNVVSLGPDHKIGNEKIDFVVPCIHGFPGETGELPGYLDMIGLKYLGNNAEKSNLCFNKLTTKLWLDKIGIPTTPYIYLTNTDQIDEPTLDKFWEKHLNLFVKASSEGSSVGCYPVTKKDELIPAIKNAFKYSDQVLIEKFVYGRELEVAAYELDGQVYATHPGEIICPSSFYSYQEKYDDSSKTKINVHALNLSEETVKIIEDFSLRAFKGLGLRHLSRIDFMEDKEGDLYINEINTFPGMTSISLFPQMLEANGHKFSDFLGQFL